MTSKLFVTPVCECVTPEPEPTQTVTHKGQFFWDVVVCEVFVLLLPIPPIAWWRLFYDQADGQKMRNVMPHGQAGNEQDPTNHHQQKNSDRKHSSKKRAILSEVFDPNGVQIRITSLFPLHSDARITLVRIWKASSNNLRKKRVNCQENRTTDFSCPGK